MRRHKSQVHHIASRIAALSGLWGVVSLPACGAAVDSAAAKQDVVPEDLDAQVRYYRLKAAKAAAGPEAEQAQARLGDAIQAAMLDHVDKANRALRDRDLAGADAEIVLASAYDAADTRVVAARGRASEVRARSAMALGQVRGLLARLEGQPFRPEQRTLWEQLAEALTWLQGWERDFPAGIELRKRAAPGIAAWKVAEAREAWRKGDADTAEARIAEAQAWQADHPDIAGLRAEQQQKGSLARDRQRVRQLVEEKQFDSALRYAEEGLRAHPGDGELAEMRAVAAKAVTDAKSAQARNAIKAGKLVEAAEALAAARQAAAGDAAAQKGLDADAKFVQKSVLALLGGRAAAARAKGHLGAAWVYGQALAAVLGPEPKRDAQQQKLSAGLDEASKYRLVYKLDPIAKDQAKELPPGYPALALSATSRAVQQALLALGPAAVTIAAGAKPAAADGQLAVSWPTYAIRRTEAPTQRQKDYLDHTELVDNPGWAEAQSKMSAALAKLNAASDEARPLREAANVSEGKLFQLQNQLADVRKRIAEEDKAAYAGKPSPCPDGSLNCAQTQAHLRWKTHLEYYERRIGEESAKLATLAPKLERLQAAEDAAKKVYDAAADAAEKSPRKVPTQAYLPYKYEVTVQTLKLTVRGVLSWTEGSGKTAVVRHQATPSLDEVQQDYVSGTVMVKGQLLEPQHASALPEDPTLAVDIANRLVTPAMGPVLDGLKLQAKRFVAKSEAATSNDERVHYLVLAWRARAALAEADRQLVSARLRDLVGLDAETGGVDLSRLGLTESKK